MASKGIGRLLNIGFAKETVRGTAEAAATYYVPVNQFDADAKINLVNEDQNLGVIEDAVGSLISKKWMEGKLTAPIGDKHIGLLLYALLGAKAVAVHAGETIVYDHTITVAQNAQHPSLTVFVDDPLAASDNKYALGMLSSMELKYELGKLMEYIANLKTKAGVSAALTPSYAGENKFLPQHLTFKLATNLAGLDAAAAIKIKSLNLKIEQNLEDDDILGSVDPNDYLNKQFAIEGSVELMWEDTTYLALLTAGTAKAMRIDLKNTDVTIGVAANPQLKIDLAKVIFKELTRPIVVNDLVKQTLSFKGFYSAADTKMVTMLLVNLVASY